MKCGFAGEPAPRAMQTFMRHFPYGRGRISATSHGHLALMDRAGQEVSRTYPAQLSIKTISNLWEISLFLILLNVHEIELLFLQKNLENATIVCYGWRARH